MSPVEMSLEMSPIEISNSSITLIESSFNTTCDTSCDSSSCTDSCTTDSYTTDSYTTDSCTIQSTHSIDIHSTLLSIETLSIATITTTNDTNTNASLPILPPRSKSLHPILPLELWV